MTMIQITLECKQCKERREVIVFPEGAASASKEFSLDHKDCKRKPMSSSERVFQDKNERIEHALATLRKASRP